MIRNYHEYQAYMQTEEERQIEAIRKFNEREKPGMFRTWAEAFKVFGYLFLGMLVASLFVIWLAEKFLDAALGH